MDGKEIANALRICAVSCADQPCRICPADKFRREDGACDVGTMLTAADYIERLQVELASLQKELTSLAIESVERANALARLGEEVVAAAGVQEELDAALEDLKTVCVSGETCAACKHCCNQGDKFPCRLGEWCGGTRWQWRGTDKEAR